MERLRAPRRLSLDDIPVVSTLSTALRAELRSRAGNFHTLLAKNLDTLKGLAPPQTTLHLACRSPKPLQIEGCADNKE